MTTAFSETQLAVLKDILGVADNELWARIEFEDWREIDELREFRGLRRRLLPLLRATPAKLTAANRRTVTDACVIAREATLNTASSVFEAETLDRDRERYDAFADELGICC
jgi:hypothetical protein